MAVDLEQSRYDKNLDILPEKAEFYPKSLPVYDDKIITGDEGLDMSDMYYRIKEFFKNSDLLVVDQPKNIALGSLNYFSDSNNIVVLKGVDPSYIYHKDFKKFKLTMRYGGVSSLLIKNSVFVEYNTIRDTIYDANMYFYKILGLTPSFRFEKV